MSVAQVRPTMSSFGRCILRQTNRSFSTSPRGSKELQDAYILSAARTPVGVFGGSLSSVPAPQLAGVAIRAALERANLPSPPTTAFMGNVLSAGVGQAPARQAVIAAGLPTSTEATTINKVCASGLKAVALAGQQISLGLESAVVAGGMENMSRSPYLYPRASQLPPFGNVQMKDAMIADGLWDVYNDIHMGSCAENTTKKFNISRKEQDDFSIESYKRAQAAWSAGAFTDEVTPVTVKGKKGDTVVEKDEGYNKLKLEKVSTLRPAFAKDGTVTAANSSSFNDGASAIVVVDAALAKSHGKGSKVLARIVSTADAATEPIDFTIAPALAVPLALKRAGLQTSDISVWEINEAFAAVVVANARQLGIDGKMETVNPRGGAISLGHAIGSSGSRILTTLLHQLKPGQFGCAAICNGGGAASAMIVQRVDNV